jgi:hypothetical protein
VRLSQSKSRFIAAQTLRLPSVQSDGQQPYLLPNPGNESLDLRRSLSWAKAATAPLSAPPLSPAVSAPVVRLEEPVSARSLAFESGAGVVEVLTPDDEERALPAVSSSLSRPHADNATATAAISISFFILRGPFDRLATAVGENPPMMPAQCRCASSLCCLSGARCAEMRVGCGMRCGRPCAVAGSTMRWIAGAVAFRFSERPVRPGSRCRSDRPSWRAGATGLQGVRR